MDNQLKILKMSKIIIFELLLLFIIFPVKQQSQSQNLTVKMNPKQIDSLMSCDFIKIELNNNSKDTILIPLEPYNYRMVKSSKDWYVGRYGNTFYPNRIYFINKNIDNYNDGTGNSDISYLKFPKILYLVPKNTTSLFLYFDDYIKNSLIGNNWYILWDVCYAYKNEINAILKDRPEYLKCEFEKSLHSQDSISILLYHGKRTTYDSSLFLYRNDYFEETIYDKIIYNFIHCFNNYNYKFD